MSAKETAIEDVSPQGGSARRRRRQLANLQNVKTGLADCIRDLESNRTDPGKARALIYGYATLAGIIQGTDIEERVAKLEATKMEPKRGGEH